MKRKSAPISGEHGNYPINFAVTAHIRGHFSPDDLSRALAKARQKQPYIAGRIQIVPDGAWYTTDDVPDLPIQLIEGDWALALATELNRSLPVETGPLVRFIMAKNDPFIDIVMICHHAIADGLSAAYILRDVLCYLADPDAAVEQIPDAPLLEDLMPPFDRSILESMTPPPQPIHLHGTRESDRSRLYVIPWSLTEAQTAALVDRCRQERTSVHGALSAAFLLAHYRLDGEQEPAVRIVSSPVNVRAHFSQPIGELFGTYINPGTTTALDLAGNRDFWEMAREVKTSLNRDTEGDKVFIPYHVMMVMIEKAFMEPSEGFMGGGDHTAPYDLSLTNLGRLDFPVDYGSLRLEAIYGPAVNPLGSEKIVGVATVGGKLTFTLVAPYWLMDRPAAEKWIDLVRQVLADAVNL